MRGHRPAATRTFRARSVRPSASLALEPAPTRATPEILPIGNDANPHHVEGLAQDPRYLHIERRGK